MSRKPTKTQAQVLRMMAAGQRLRWHESMYAGMSGPEIDGRGFWPTKRTVRSMLDRDLLKWGEQYPNFTFLEMTEAGALFALPRRKR